MRRDSDPFGDEEPAEVSISALIDVGMLLLAFFLAATTLARQEADLGMVLPGEGAEKQESGGATKAPKIEEMYIRIDADGIIWVNEEEASSDPTDRDVPDVKERLERYAFSASIAEAQPLVIIESSDDVEEQRFVDALNACAAAGIKNISLVQ